MKGFYKNNRGWFFVVLILLFCLYLYVFKVVHILGVVLYDTPVHSDQPHTKNEQLILDKIKTNKEKSIYFIDLDSILEKPIRKFCFKEPKYFPDDASYLAFEKKSSIPVKTYIKAHGFEKSKGYYWVLYKDGMVENLNIVHSFFEFGNEINAIHSITCTEKSKIVFEQ
jgi:hypothetical protein